MSTHRTSFSLFVHEPVFVSPLFTYREKAGFFVQGSWTPTAGAKVEVVTLMNDWNDGNMLQSDDLCARALGQAVANLFVERQVKCFKRQFAKEYAPTAMKRLSTSHLDDDEKRELWGFIVEAVIEKGNTLSDDDLVELCEDFPGVELIEQPEAEKAVAA